MFVILKNNVVVGMVDGQPDGGDLETRGEVAVEVLDATPSLGDIYDPLGMTFSTPELSLDDLTQAKRLELMTAANAAIEAGITHNVLGADHVYPTKRDDQNNLSALSLKAERVDRLGEAWAARFWCADAADVWMRRVHTAAQIIDLGETVMLHVQSQQDHYEIRLAELASAALQGDRAGVEAVVW
ncbi:MAG: hypothetical protein JMN25_15830 [gamma proteobacterium endosymbiont of Lamellibrachia anaximandri]|nr:hypothetical protein [gamma proteobacterium endosymbiont of Lamellibrachia anaximandri]